MAGFHWETGQGTLTRHDEEVCGDRIEIVASPAGLVAVLADGVGTGIQANILATLTSRILSVMISRGESVEDAVNMVAGSLPVNRGKGRSYTLFSILQIDEDGQATLLEMGMPPAILLRRGHCLDLKPCDEIIAGKEIRKSTVAMKDQDLLILYSNGVERAGQNQEQPEGWRREGIMRFLQAAYRPGLQAEGLNKLLLSACESLSGGKPEDDAAILTIRILSASRADGSGEVIL
ncbi:MAG: SpoIIE family protein phosphatase [Clostridiaceae bacterium]|nr:SpoIIE family protein phosphatase [Clostridiaceae bacterium]